MPTSPPLTEKNLPDQTGKIFIVTGATSGVGLELTQILYSKNAKIYLAARSSSKATTTISQIKSSHPSSTGALIHLPLDLNDLTTIKQSAEFFLARESRLHVLWNNAGVMIPPQGSTTAQGYELQLGTNCVAPFLFTHFLTPTLVETAKESVQGSVRVVWVSSSAPARFAPTNGLEMANLDYHVDLASWKKYGVSKAGNIFHAREMARRLKGDGVVSVSLDPGNLKTDLYRHVPWFARPLVNLILKEPIYGAYTELYGGLSPDITLKDSGVFLEPWGTKGATRDDIERAANTVAEGGTGLATEFWEWTEKQVQSYV